MTHIDTQQIVQDVDLQADSGNSGVDAKQLRATEKKKRKIFTIIQPRDAVPDSQM